MRKYVFSLIVVIILSSISNKLMAQTSPGSELGDAMFRPLM